MNHTMQGTKRFRGLIHIHTTYSYDGTFSLQDFVNLAKSRHYDFIILTEHAEDFDEKKMQIVVNECSNVSDEAFLVIPGLEFNVNGIHILGIGIENYIRETEPGELIRKIHENNGLAVLAHTADYKSVPYAHLKDVDLIEIWNPRYGERLSPSITSIHVLYEFRTMKKTYIASGGLDFHTIKDLVHLHQSVFCDRLTQRDILTSLEQGEFTTIKGFIELSPLNDPAISMTALIYLSAFVQCIPNTGKKIMRKIYRMWKFMM
jgi:predicted metal-dependent phosphoesterase TrpH